MFGNKKKKLEAKYKKLSEEAYRLSTVDRTKSDAKTAKAEEVLKQIEAIDAQDHNSVHSTLALAETVRCRSCTGGRCHRNFQASRSLR